jgi:hypothetical protein
MKDNHEDLKNQMYNLGVQLRTLSYETQKLDASKQLCCHHLKDDCWHPLKQQFGLLTFVLLCVY